MLREQPRAAGTLRSTVKCAWQLLHWSGKVSALWDSHLGTLPRATWHLPLRLRPASPRQASPAAQRLTRKHTRVPWRLGSQRAPKADLRGRDRRDRERERRARCAPMSPRRPLLTHQGPRGGRGADPGKWNASRACPYGGLMRASQLGRLHTSWLTGKDPDAGKDWRPEKWTTEDEMVGWHHRLDGHEFEQAPGVADGQGSLAHCSPRGHRVRRDLTTEQWTTAKECIPPHNYNKEF